MIANPSEGKPIKRYYRQSNDSALSQYSRRLRGGLRAEFSFQAAVRSMMPQLPVL